MPNKAYICVDNIHVMRDNRHMAKAIPRAAMRAGVRRIARVAGVGYRTALRHEKKGLFVYGDLYSVSKYICKRRLERITHDELSEAFEIIHRYRTETPLGNQPHMIAEKVDEWLKRNGE